MLLIGLVVFLEVNKEELKKIPYIDNIPSDGRIVFLQPYFDKADKTFKMFVPSGGDKLTWIFAEPVQGCYFSDVIMDKTNDIHIRLIDTIVQYYSFKPVLYSLLEIVRDIINCGTVVEKYFIFLKLYRETKDASIHNFVETDLEYFFGNVRSLYDLLQVITRDLWEISRGVKLPNSFHDMAKQDSKDLQKKYDLPEPLIEYYLNSKDFFLRCCNVRDNIYHYWMGSGLHGAIGMVICFDEGFALLKNSVLSPNVITREFDIWPKEKIKPNELVSVLGLISYINKRTMENLEDFSHALIQSIKPCTPISETHRVFLRSPYLHHLIQSDEYLEKQWIEEKKTW